MHVLSSSQIRAADAYTIQNEPIESINLMERASLACANRVLSLYDPAISFSVFCGVGNNGGDGLAIARLLKAQNRKVDVVLVHFSSTQSSDNKSNELRLVEGGVKIHSVFSKEDLPEIKADVIIDALVGTGLTRPLSGLLLDTVSHINATNKECLAIDIPSGMFCEEDNSKNFDKIIRASRTLTFEVPKLNFFFPDMFQFTGKWELLDIGLNKEFMNDLVSAYTYVDHLLISSIYTPRNEFAHKGNFGHALLFVGSHGKMGAAVLATKACIRSGAGLVTGLIPESGYQILQATVPEVMVITTKEGHASEEIDSAKYAAIGIGPGIGIHQNASSLVELLVKKTKKPLVIDADGINILSQNPALLNEIPKGSILTPHVKEFERLFGAYESCFARQQAQVKASIDFGVHIVLKGKFTSITTPEGQTYFNSTGNPGMATAGSGDVLTGIITGLLSQGYSATHSCVFGCYLHGLSGDLAAKEQSQESLIASDIIDFLGKAYKAIQE